MVLCLGRGRRGLVRCGDFGANVVQGASVLGVTGSSVAKTMVREGVSVPNVIGSKTDVVGGISGFAVLLGLGSNCFGGIESGWI